jgi:hypothetical protein
LPPLELKSFRPPPELALRAEFPVELRLLPPKPPLCELDDE